MNITSECPKCDHPMDYEVEFGEAPIPCQDHDAPAYGDPGTPGGVDGILFCPKCRAPIDHDKVYSAASEHAACEQEAAYEAHIDAEIDRRRGH